MIESYREKIIDKLNEYLLRRDLKLNPTLGFIEIDEFYNIYVSGNSFYVWDRKLGKNIYLKDIDVFIRQ